MSSINQDYSKVVTADQIDMEEALTNALTNAMIYRREFASKFIDERRDVDKECGYKKTEELDAIRYKYMYDREAIARRVVEVLPQESWVVSPTITETEDQNETTPFEEAWQNINKNLISDDGEESYYDQEGSNPIWSYLLRADELSGIGSFGLMLLGVDDGLELHEPAVLRPDAKLLYIRVFDETLVSVDEWEKDKTNPRYGKPITYNVSLVDYSVTSRSTANEVNVQSSIVHWTRIIHVADNLGSSEYFGVPRMQTVWNRLYDLRKLYGASAEMYWMGAFMGFSFETHPQLGPNVELPKEKIREMTQAYKDGLQRFFALEGATTNPLAPQVVDPTPQIMVAIKAICILLGVPERIFFGSERGELASSQDERAWNKRMSKRQEKYITPRLIVPLVNRLINLGVLPEPTEGFKVTWPDRNESTPLEEAQINLHRTDMLTKYVAGDVNLMMSEIDFYTRILGFDQEEAQEIIDTAAEDFETSSIEANKPDEPDFGMVDEFGNPIAAPPMPPTSPQNDKKESMNDPAGKGNQSKDQQKPVTK